MKVLRNIKKFFRTSTPGVYGVIRDSYQFMRYRYRKSIPSRRYPNELKKQYRKYFGTELNIDSPQKYSEKMQWLKLYDDNTLRTELSDKAKVRSWIKEKIGEEYLIPLIGIYKSCDDINWDKLPNRFVIKMNHASGWNIVVKDKAKLNIKDTEKKLRRWLKLDYGFWNGYEIHYSPIKPRIVIEKYIEDSKGVLNDYKFLCFNGEVKYCWVDFDRDTNHKRNVYDEKWNIQPWNQMKYGNYNGEVRCPDNYNEMWSIADTLCKGFRHVRVDLYNVDGKIYFGEMTFTNGSGFEGIFPEEYEYKLGDLIPLPTDKKRVIK